MGKKRILIVDDEPANLSLLEAILEPRGYEVVKAENGMEALAKAVNLDVDLVLLDVMMPTINGFDVCKKLKEDERYRTIPIVLLTSLRSKQDRIRGIEAGAEDFISKPFDQGEVLARIAMLLKMKELNDYLEHAYININDLTYFGETLIQNFNPMSFDFIIGIEQFFAQFIAMKGHSVEKPSIIIVGVISSEGWQWLKYTAETGTINRSIFKLDLHSLIPYSDEPVTGQYNMPDLAASDWNAFINKAKELSIEVKNMVYHVDNELTVMAINYGRKVTRHDAAVLNNLVLHIMFLKSLSGQIKETENAFEYTIHALARASEANDEDTGNHIMRVGEYCAALAVKMGFPEEFIQSIRLQAPMHDIGKIHVHPDILKKPGKLTPEEFEKNRFHTIYGAKIIGDHPRLAMARRIALCHHERWDGSGYPMGLKEEAIPVEARLLTIADQYDALRNARVYKPAFDHKTAYSIIAEGDGRTMPYHFDPAVYTTFKDISPRFEEIYEQLKG